MATRKIVVHVMNDPKNKVNMLSKSSVLRSIWLWMSTVMEFLVMDVHETMQKLVDTYGELLGFHEKESAEIGYIGYSNKKYKIASNDDLQKAFESGDLHKEKQPVFYICGKQEKAIKRAAQDFGNVSVSDDSPEELDDDGAKSKKRRKQSGMEKFTKRIIERLRSIHGESCMGT